MLESVELLINLGYSKKDAEAITSSYSLVRYKDETLCKKIYENYNYLNELGYTKTDIIKMTKSLPQLYSFSKETIANKIKFLISLGYTKTDVIKMTKILPALYGLSKETIEEKISFLISLGYTKADVIKMTKSLPTLYGLSKENIEEKIEFLISLGYTKADVIKMTKSLPSLYGYSKETIEEKISFLISLGYTKSDVINMTKSLSTLYSLSKENIEEKIKYLKDIGLEDIVINDTKKLMQSAPLTYARYEFLTKERGILIDETNYNKLFCNETMFKKQYGVSKEVLLKKYSYEEYKKNNNFKNI